MDIVKAFYYLLENLIRRQISGLLIMVTAIDFYLVVLYTL